MTFAKLQELCIPVRNDVACLVFLCETYLGKLRGESGTADVKVCAVHLIFHIMLLTLLISLSFSTEALS